MSAIPEPTDRNSADRPTVGIPADFGIVFHEVLAFLTISVQAWRDGHVGHQRPDPATLRRAPIVQSQIESVGAEEINAAIENGLLKAAKNLPTKERAWALHLGGFHVGGWIRHDHSEPPLKDSKAREIGFERGSYQGTRERLKSLPSSPRSVRAFTEPREKLGGLSRKQQAAAALTAALFEITEPVAFVERADVIALIRSRDAADGTEQEQARSTPSPSPTSPTSLSPAVGGSYRHKPWVIRDPIHGYIPFTSLEAALLEAPIMQRLRYVSQMAASQFVFPSATTTRFEHSIGAMHVASRLYRGAITNADKAFRVRVVKAARKLAESGLASDDPPDERERVLIAAGLDPLPFGDTSSERVGLAIVEQALRIASLLHDLGHLPFGHDMERALASLAKHGDFAARCPSIRRFAVPRHAEVHEQIGRRIGRYLLEARSSIVARPTPLDDRLRPLAARAVELAGDILRRGASGAASLQGTSDLELLTHWLHTLVNGQLDADRCDYVLRDGRAHSIPGVSYDLDRVVRSVVVAQSPITTRGWALTIRGSGQAAVEEFLIARTRLYSWGIYHHKAQGIALALRNAIVALGRRDSSELHEFISTVEDLLSVDPSIGDVGSLTSAVEKFTRWDDWCAREALLTEARANPLDRVAADIYAFVHRRGPGYQSLWKARDDLGPDESTIQDRIRIINSNIEEDRSLEDDASDGPFARWQRGLMERSPSDAKPDNYPVYVVPHEFEPYSTATASALLVQPRSGTNLVELASRSPLVKALNEERAQEPHFHAYVWAGGGWISPTGRVNIGESIMREL